MRNQHREVSRLSFGWRLGGLCAAWLVGVLLHLQLPALPPPAWTVAMVVAATAFAFMAAQRRWYGLGVLAITVLGFGLSVGQATHRLAQALPAHLEREDLTLEGVVASLPQVLDNGRRFRFDVHAARWNDTPVDVPPSVLLGWYAGFGGRASSHGPPPDLRAGDRWRFTVRLRRPHGLRNPFGFDQELHLFEQGVRAVGSVRPGAGPAPERLAVRCGHPVERLRQHVRDALFATVTDLRAAGVLAALSVGDQAAIVVAVNKPIFSLPGKRPQPSIGLTNSRFGPTSSPSTDETLKAYSTARTASRVEGAHPLRTGRPPGRRATVGD